MRKLIAIILGLVSWSSLAQISANPEFPTADNSVVITFDATLGTGGLAGFTGDVYAHTGVITSQSTSPSDWKYVKTNWGQNTPETKLTRIGTNLYTLAISPSIRAYYGVPESEDILQMAFVFRSADNSLEGKGDGNSDIFYDVLTGDFAISLSAPEQASFFVDENEQIQITASSSADAAFTLTVNDQIVDQASGTSSYSYLHTVTESSGSGVVVLSAMDGESNTDEVTFTYTLRSAPIQEARPSGIIPGINYHDTDQTKATLCLQAPGKSSAYVIGDFNNWTLNSDYQMKADGEYFWLEISGLTSGTEYAYQYMVDETIFTADPYCDKILDLNDKWIPAGIYPNLKEYPQEASNPVNIYKTLSVLQTGQTPFQWQHADYDRPAQSELVVYELLIRDFFNNGQESYKNLTDTLSYLKSLGVNAIELMPVTEFNGNDSWGYNPTFMFAPDKAYGPKDELKRFIDAAHGLGMAVILDMVLNQQDLPSPLLLLDWNFDTNRPSNSSPYFNNNGPHENGATHEFSVFYDMNHSSAYTQAFVDTVNHYWINEYKFDGYRFDLTKGFMQSGSFHGYNQGRIDILKRMADEIWSYDPTAYVILEHLGDNAEEKALANHGMMLWGIMHANFKELILGYKNNSSNISWSYHKNRGFNDPHNVVYMESHDEERQIYEAMKYGNASISHNVKDLSTSLDRMGAASAFLYLVPGPRMLWQFGEVGYDISINDNGRTGQKPNPWGGEGLEYFDDASRNKLRQVTSELIKLKTSYSVFNTGNVVSSWDNELAKILVIENLTDTDNPASADEMDAVVIGNFDVVDREITVDFTHSGSWFNYFTGGELVVQNASATVTLGPGQFKVFTDFELEKPDVVILGENQITVDTELTAFPNPSSGVIQVDVVGDSPLYYFMYELSGRMVKRGKFNENPSLDASELKSGLYLLEVITRSGNRLVNRISKK